MRIETWDTDRVSDQNEHLVDIKLAGLHSRENMSLTRQIFIKEMMKGI